jgi:Ca2+-dependent lipid-binding protein
VVCELVRSSIEPLLDDMKPPFIAKMGFQKLTLGVRAVPGGVRGTSCL